MPSARSAGSSWWQGHQWWCAVSPLHCPLPTEAVAGYDRLRPGLCGSSWCGGWVQLVWWLSGSWCGGWVRRGHLGLGSSCDRIVESLVDSRSYPAIGLAEVEDVHHLTANAFDLGAKGPRGQGAKGPRGQGGATGIMDSKETAPLLSKDRMVSEPPRERVGLLALSWPLQDAQEGLSEPVQRWDQRESLRERPKTRAVLWNLWAVFSPPTPGSSPAPAF